MARAFLRPLLALAALLLVWGAETGLGSCLGGSCAEQAASAKAQGLLGSSLGSLGICEPKKYPTTGSLVPVTLDTRITDVRWVNVTASGDVQHVYAITQDKGGFNGGPLWRTEDPGRADGWRDITSTLIGAGGRGDVCSGIGIDRDWTWRQGAKWGFINFLRTRRNILHSR